MALPVRQNDGRDESTASSRWSIMFSEPLAGVLGGVTATAYGFVFLTLLIRDAWNPVPDLFSFALYAGVTLTGVINVVRWLPSVRDRSIARVGIGYVLVMVAWSYFTARYSSPLSDWEGLVYGSIAAAGLAAIVDDVRLWTRSSRPHRYSRRWVFIPATVFAVWTLLDVNGIPTGWDWFALAAVPLGLGLVVRGYGHMQGTN
ncbi:MAG: hypothetical protein NVS4B2_14190 [Chloroflexota bacterium]